MWQFLWILQQISFSYQFLTHAEYQFHIFLFYSTLPEHNAKIKLNLLFFHKQ